MSKRLLLLFVCAATLSTAAAAVPPGVSFRNLDFDGLARSYRLYVPPGYDGSTPVPLVVDLHGFGSNATQQAAISRWRPIADRETLLLVHPEGVNNAWDAGNCCGNAGLDDVGFLRAVVADMMAAANVDAARVYATGLSNGGAMTQRLACDAGDLFAAFAPMAFPIPFANFTSCQPARSVSVLTFMGLTDVLVSYNGGIFGSAPDTFAYWRDIDGCGTGQPDERVEQGASRCETFTHCNNGVQAGLCSITANSFGGSPFDGHILYLNPDFELAEVAWAFMSQYRLPAASTPMTATLTGTSRLKRPGRPTVKQPLTWTLTLGDGTWVAEEPPNLVYTGSATSKSPQASALALGLTEPARDALLAALSAATSDTFTLVDARIAAHVARAAGRVTVSGRLRLDGVASSGIRYSFRLRGR